MAVATIAVSIYIRTWNRRMMALSCLAIYFIANFFSIIVTAHPVLIALRIASGFGAGGLIAMMSAAVGSTRNIDRNFAFYLVSTQLCAAAVYRFLPILQEYLGSVAVFYPLCAVSLLGIAVVYWFPGYAPALDPEVSKNEFSTAPATKVNWKEASLGLAAIFIFFSGVGGFWPFMNQIGIELGLGQGPTTSALSNATLAGAIAALTVTVLGVRFGRTLPLIIGTLGLVGILLVFELTEPQQVFALAAQGFMFCWVLTVPYLVGVAAELDSSGRVVVLSMTMQLAGLTLGPLIATTAFGFGATLVSLPWIAIVGCFTSLLLLLPAVRLSSKCGAEKITS
jgi:predicted MFS family arabinose efflux permease